MKTIITSPEYVYESPDNGNTVFRRLIGSNDRELIIQKEPNLFDYATFQEIQEMSKTSKSLKKALDNVALIYYTIKDGKET